MLQVKPSTKADRQCEVCRAGEVDHDSNPSTPCIPCPDGTLQPQPGQTECLKAEHVCPKGTFEIKAATKASLSVCAMCNGITEYQDKAGQTSCKLVSDCPAGTFVSGSPSADSDRQCTACNGITEYQGESMKTACLAVTPRCGFGHFEVAAPTTTTDRLCAKCTLGLNYQDEDKVGQTSCKNVSSCTIGTAQLREPTLVSDRLCVLCNGRTEYQDTENAMSCKAVSECKPGEFVQEAATSISDVECRNLTVCNETEFQSTIGSGDRLCKAHRLCDWPTEYEYRAPTETSDRICGKITECRPGLYELEPPAVSQDKDRVCQQCRVCVAGQYMVSNCTATADTICRACSSCEDGTFEEQACSGPGGSSDTVCTACSDCDGELIRTSNGALGFARQYTQSVCTRATDSVCGTCSECDPWDFESQPCTATADTKCTLRCGYELVDAATSPATSSSPDSVTDSSSVGSGDDPDSSSSSRPGLGLVTASSTISVADSNSSGSTFYMYTIPVTGDSTQFYRWGGAEYLDGASCKTVSGRCDPKVMYEFRGSTPSSDRLCKRSSRCGKIQYEAVPATSSSDRICRDLTVCTVQEMFEVVPATASSDRQCALLTACNITREFVSVVPTATSDRVCSQLTECPDGYVKENATETTDRVCTNQTGRPDKVRDGSQDLGVSPTSAESTVSDIVLKSVSDSDDKLSDDGLGGIILAVVLVLIFCVVMAFIVQRSLVASKVADINNESDLLTDLALNISAGAVDPSRDVENPAGDFWKLQELDTEVAPVGDGKMLRQNLTAKSPQRCVSRTMTKRSNNNEVHV